MCFAIFAPSCAHLPIIAVLSAIVITPYKPNTGRDHFLQSTMDDMSMHVSACDMASHVPLHTCACLGGGGGETLGRPLGPAAMMSAAKPAAILQISGLHHHVIDIERTLYICASHNAHVAMGT